MITHIATADQLPQLGWVSSALIFHWSHHCEGLALFMPPWPIPYTPVLLKCPPPPLWYPDTPPCPFTLLDRCTCGPIALVMQGVLTTTEGPVAVSLSGKRHRSGVATILLSVTGLEPCLPPHHGAKCNHRCPKFSILHRPFMSWFFCYLREAYISL